MKKIQSTLSNENHVSIQGLLLAFLAGCLAATLFWYFIV